MRQELKRDEILNFVSKKYPLYAWSLHTLCHCLYYFEDIIKCMNYEIEVDDLEESVLEEMNGPGNFKQLLDEVFVISRIIKVEVLVLSAEAEG